jgi:FkbM family methyltransferase
VKNVYGWWMPDHEAHLGPWMAAPKNKLLLNGRQAYQGRKQIAALKHCTHHRVALDVGGHVGLWSFNLAHEFAAVYAFEPVAEHRACFEKNLAGIGQHVHLKAMALGAEAGSISIATEPGSSGNSTISGAGEIPMVTLDSLEIPDVDFVKVDCEGYEENVLRGGVETIKACRPVIIVEQKRDMAAKMGLKTLGAVQFLKTLGYHVAEEISGDYIMVPQ